MSDKEKIEKLTQTLNGLLNCPHTVDADTCPRGIDQYPPTQVVFEYSINYARVLAAQEVLKEVAQ